MRHPVLALASLALACGAPGRPDRAETPPRDAPVEVLVASSDRLEDPVSTAIQHAIDRELGFPVRVVARAQLGGEQLVLYAMNAATHWLSTHPDREALVREIEDCERGEEEDEHNCIDTVLREGRDPLLRERSLVACRARNDPSLPDLEEMCRDEFENTFVFDVEAYCEAGFWMKATPAENRWTLAPAGRLPEPCLRSVIGLRVVDLDGDARAEILLDAVYSRVDSMRLITELDVRTLSVWHGPGPELARSSSILLGTYSADLSASSELRCRHELTSGARPSLRLECCELPLDEDEEEVASIDFAAWPSPGTCGPRWTDTYPPAERGFRECHVVASGDVTLREGPDEGSEALTNLSRREILHVIGERGDWLEVVTREGAGWVPAAQTRDECRAER